MPRNSSGSYTLPSGNPVVTRTTVSSTWANSTLTDLGTELTSSLDRSGRGPMLAPLPLANGSNLLPALTWAAETSSGLFRNATNDFRFAVAGNAMLEFLATGLVGPYGLTLTQIQANTVALTATGSGTAAAANFTGGSSNGAGLITAGGGTSGDGVVATAGSSSGVGVRGTGAGANSGVVGTGGTTSGAGGHFTGGAPNGRGVSADGTGTGDGVVATGGTTSGIGVTANGGGTGAGVVATGGASNADGVRGFGGGSGTSGVYGEGGANGTGVWGKGTGTGPGFTAQPGASTTTAIACVGIIDMTSSATVGAAPGDKRVSYANVTRAAARMTVTGVSGAQTLNASYNMASAVVGGTGNQSLVFTFDGVTFSSSSSFWATAQLVQPFPVPVAAFNLALVEVGRSATSVTFVLRTSLGTNINWTAADAGTGVSITVGGF